MKVQIYASYDKIEKTFVDHMKIWARFSVKIFRTLSYLCEFFLCVSRLIVPWYEQVVIDGFYFILFFLF